MIFARIAFFLILSAPVWAADGPGYSNDPAIGVKRVMTKDPETTDSKCVGDPKTPVCALETMLACLVRQQPDLCRKMGIRRGCFEKRLYKREYVIISSNRIDQKNIPAYIRIAELESYNYSNVWYQLIYCDRTSPYKCHDSITSGNHIIFAQRIGKDDDYWMAASQNVNTDLCDGLDSDH
jgi:hypothetical protein